MKHLRSLVPVLALALLGAGCLSPATRDTRPASSETPPAPGTSTKPSEPALPEGTLETKRGNRDRIRNVKLITATDGIVSSPLLITGEARLWYFEGVFPIKLIDGNGRIIVSGQAEADGEWTTDEWVPFTAELNFSTQLSGSKGRLIFLADNPSDLPENDDSFSIPVSF